MLALPFTSNLQSDWFARPLGTASILLALAGILPASYRTLSVAREHDRSVHKFPLAACSRSMASNSALKLPLPKLFAPLR